MSITVRISAPFQTLTRGKAVLSVHADTVAEALAEVDRCYPGLRNRVVDDAGHVFRFTRIDLNGEDIRYLHGVETPLENGDTLSILQALAGG
jgi:molybdopterin synthase sulfur carrier subunit